MQARTQLSLRITSPCLFVMLWLSPPLHAQTQPAAPTAAEATLKKPTDFRSRAEVRNEYQDLEGDGYRNLISPRFEYAVSSSLALRLETPYVVTDPGTPGAERTSGLGDLFGGHSHRKAVPHQFAQVRMARQFEALVAFAPPMREAFGPDRIVTPWPGRSGPGVAPQFPAHRRGSAPEGFCN